MWPIATIKKLNKEKAEKLWGCYHCAKAINTDQAYFEIMHYVPHPGKSSQKHFHEACFEEIAGKAYAS